jgi:hypothetical protein
MLYARCLQSPCKHYLCRDSGIPTHKLKDIWSITWRRQRSFEVKKVARASTTQSFILSPARDLCTEGSRSSGHSACAVIACFTCPGGFYLRFLHRPFLIGFCWTNQKAGKKGGVILASTSWLRSGLNHICIRHWKNLPFAVLCRAGCVCFELRVF